MKWLAWQMMGEQYILPTYTSVKILTVSNKILTEKLIKDGSEESELDQNQPGQEAWVVAQSLVGGQ